MKQPEIITGGGGLYPTDGIYPHPKHESGVLPDGGRMQAEIAKLLSGNPEDGD